jgi:hypothetical protein
MSVQAYITAGANIIECLVPDEAMVDVARQIGIPQEDLFRVDIPAGMTRHVSASCLVKSTQLANLYATTTVTLTLSEATGTNIVLQNLYVRPPQPFLWRQPGGPVLVELVDERWYWQFSSAAQLGQALAPTYSSDGRWQTNFDVGGPDPIISYAALINEIDAVASSLSLVSPVGFTTRTPEYLRRLSDLYGSPNASLALVLDAIASANRQVIIQTGAGTRFIEINTLKTQYDTRMNAQKRAMAGGMNPVNGTAGGTDALVNNWNQAGYQTTAPRDANVIMPNRSVEGLTVYGNVDVNETPATQQNFAMKQVYAAQATPAWTRSPIGRGAGQLTEAAVVVNNNAGAPLTTTPGWNPAPLVAEVQANYASRYANTPFGRTVWAGWVPYYIDSTTTIGQLGTVSYRLAVVDGKWSPYTITELKIDDWRFGLQGTAETDPAQLVTAKGKAQAYRNLVGATIVDVPPPNTRVFPARVTAATQCTEGEGTIWRWFYEFQEVEPNPDDTACPTQYVSVTPYGRTGTKARNMAEAGNVFLGPGNAGNVVAPGVLQSHYTGVAVISALPISVGTIVEMVEHFPTIYTGLATAPYEPQYWFSMPNAVRIECAETPGE